MISPVGTKLSRRGATRAFSLVELLTVAAIMGLLAGVAAISIRGFRSPVLNGAASEVASALKSARQMAIASGRRTYLVIPIFTNEFSTNLFRSYAIFEQIPTEETSRNPPYATNNTNLVRAASDEVVCEALTDWRTLPEGTVFCNLAAGGYSLQRGDAMPADTELGQPIARLTGKSMGSAEWKYFESTTNFYLCNPGDLKKLGTNSLRQAAFLGFYPNGRGNYNDPNYGGGAGLRVALGFVRNGQVAITDNKNAFYVEVDAFSGRVRMRPMETFGN